MCKKEYVQHPLFASYLAGLWEGDGHIVCPRYNQQNVCTNTPSFHITFARRNSPVCHLLRSHYGGWIRKKEKENALVWSISKLSDLMHITALLNGLLRTPKIYQFHQLIAYLNRKSPLNKGEFKGLDNSPLESNYWLSGLIDSDGGFKIRTSLIVRKGGARKGLPSMRGSSFRIECRFVIEQRKHHKRTNQSFQPIFAKIAQFLGSNCNTSRHNSREYWCVESSSPSKLAKLVQYLDQYPLLTIKFNDYQDWRKSLDLIVCKAHLTEGGCSQIVEIKSNINSKRILSLDNWNHIT